MNSEQLESAKKLFFIALCIDLAITAIIGFKSLATIDTFKAIESGALAVDQALIRSIGFWENFSGLAVVTTICVGLALVKWLNTCYRYAKATIGANGFKNENWTAGGWIIPIINLFKPYQIISEIYKAGAPNYVGTDDWKKESGSGLLLAWWIFWSVTHFIAVIISKQLFKSSLRDDVSLSQAIGLYGMQVGSCAISIIIVVLWFMVANHLTQRLLDRKPLESPSNAKSPLPSHSQALPTTSKSSVEPEFEEYRGNEVIQPAAAPMMKAPELPATTAHEHSSATPMSRKSEAYVPTSSAAGLVAMPDSDDWAYEMVALELDQNDQDKAQWTRAFAETGGDENKTKALYIQRRVQRIVATEAERIRELNAQRARELEAEKLRHSQEIETARQERERERQEKLEAEGRRLQELEAERQECNQPIPQLVPEQSQRSSGQQPGESPFSIGKILIGIFVALGAVVYFAGTPSTPGRSQQVDQQAGQQVTTVNDAYVRGETAYKSGDFAGAIKEWKPLAIQGNADAQTGLGWMYANGHGIAQDYKQAFDWLSKAAAQGHSAAQRSLGWMYANGHGIAQDYKQAFDWLSKAAAQGDAGAQYGLGWMYANGHGIAQDYKQAFEWYSKAAAQGDAGAQYGLGWMYANGHGIAQDYKQAFEWYSKAAAQGHSAAQRSLGWMYANGHGIAQDYKQAFEWLSKAAAQGDAEGQKHLGKMFELGKGVPQDLAKAFEWYQKAAIQGDADAQNDVGWHYEQAIGVPQNLAEAARWYRLAAQQGDPYAQNNLGLMYERGRYFEQNDDEALKWYRLVIAHGDKVDTDRLASHFTRDQLTEKSIQKAGLSVKP